MSAFGLRVVAWITMFIDHTAYALFETQRINNYDLYVFLRIIGRIAFPVFGFQIAKGAVYTKDTGKYFLRLTLLAVISEIPYDFLITGSLFDKTSQNVAFTLIAGLACVCILKWGSRLKGTLAYLGWALWAVFTLTAGWIAKYGLKCDYGFGGVLMVSIMGITAAPLKEIRGKFASERFVNLIFSAFGIIACSVFAGEIELYALFALLPIFLYNGEKGISGTKSKVLGYLFYPAHMLIITLVFYVL